MIVVRNVFQLKFGKAREALAVMKEGIAIQKRLAAEGSARLLTDVTGRHYTLVDSPQVHDALLELRFTPGISAYAFTFG